MNFFSKYLKSKFIFTKPKKAKILIYDKGSLQYLGFFLKKNYEIYYVRGEIVNMFILFYTFFSNGLFNFNLNYKLNYFKFVNPKYIITGFDENYHFFIIILNKIIISFSILFYSSC